MQINTDLPSSAFKWWISVISNAVVWRRIQNYCKFYWVISEPIVWGSEYLKLFIDDALFFGFLNIPSNILMLDLW